MAERDQPRQVGTGVARLDRARVLEPAILLSLLAPTMIRWN
jgi:hypothetical protein